MRDRQVVQVNVVVWAVLVMMRSLSLSPTDVEVGERVPEPVTPADAAIRRYGRSCRPASSRDLLPYERRRIASIKRVISPIQVVRRREQQRHTGATGVAAHQRVSILPRHHLSGTLTTRMVVPRP